MKKGVKIAIISICSFITGCIAMNILACPIVFSAIFEGNKSKDPSITPGLIDYAQIAESYPRQEVKFNSKTSTLNGYLYENDLTDKLLVFTHGIHSSAADYLNVVKYFYDTGYSVFAYDGKGVNNENDNALGMFPEGIISLEGALDYLNSIDFLTNRKVYLMGHSWGGYSSLAVLHKTKYKIAGVASISGFNSGEQEVINYARPYMSIIADILSPFVFAYQRSVYPKYSYLNAIDGVNKYKDVKVFLAHGKDDENFNIKNSLVAMADQINATAVETYTGEGVNGGHTSILYSKSAVNYQKEVDEKITSFVEENQVSELKKYIASVNDHKYSELNQVMFSQLVAFFN